MSERELGCCNEDVIQAVRVLVFGDGSGDAAMPLCSLSKRSQQGDFDLYVQVIDELCGWLFIFDQTHYSRWLPIHVKDMVELEKKHPHVLEEFRKGNFVVQKSEKNDSLIPKDHSHEQTTKLCESASGVANLFDMSDTMDEHVMALNEKLQALADFEDAADISATAQHLGHHEEGHSLQMRFAKDVLSVISVLRPRNPFLPHNGPDLVTLHTREVMPSAIAQTLCNAHNRGKDLHDAFVSDRLRNGRVAITYTIKRSVLQTFTRRTDDTKNRSKVIAMRKDISFVSTLFLSLQSRPDFDLDNFFKYENQSHHRCLTRESADPAQSLMSYNV